MSMELVDKHDLEELKNELLAHLEKVSGNPMKLWFNLEDLAELRACSVKELMNNPLEQPNFGIPDDRWGRDKVFSRETTLRWLMKPRREIKIMVAALSPQDIEEINLKRKTLSWSSR